MKTSHSIPTHHLDHHHRERHRNNTNTTFGYNQLPASRYIPGFELYSSEGMIGNYGPAKSTFYRMGIVLSGSLQMQVGLEHFTVTAGDINFSIPGQVHSKYNVSSDAFGYYLFFDPGFLENIIPAGNPGTEFPFLDYSGTQFFHCSTVEIDQITSLLLKINEELQEDRPGRTMAIKMYLYLALLEARRSYERQSLHLQKDEPLNGINLVTRFHKLVSQHFLTMRQVAAYAQLLFVTPNHLNRVVKNTTGKTASDAINEMLLQEAKVLLRSTTLSAAEIAYQLDFSEPAAFNHFFKKLAQQTPLAYRNSVSKTTA